MGPPDDRRMGPPDDRRQGPPDDRRQGPPDDRRPGLFDDRKPGLFDRPGGPPDNRRPGGPPDNRRPGPPDDRNPDWSGGPPEKRWRGPPEDEDDVPPGGRPNGEPPRDFEPGPQRQPPFDPDRKDPKLDMPEGDLPPLGKGDPEADAERPPRPDSREMNEDDMRGRRGPGGPLPGRSPPRPGQDAFAEDHWDGFDESEPWPPGPDRGRGPPTPLDGGSTERRPHATPAAKGVPSYAG
ncbi:hypothetical protein MTO96_014660 [Rhipicephalus appendiculatus]